MSHKKCVEALDRSLQDIRNNNLPMGGITVLFSGDFRQTLPVIPSGTPADEINACLKSSHLWKKMVVLHLSKNMRVHVGSEKNMEEFAQILLEMGNGTRYEVDDRIVLDDNTCVVVNQINELIAKIYPNMKKIQSIHYSWFKERAILSARNEDVLEINNLCLKNIESPENTYLSIDSTTEIENAVHYPVEFLNTLNPAGCPPHTLHLKVGVPIMLLRNLKPPKLCNGTRLIIIALHKYLIEAKIITGPNEGETVFIPKIPVIPSNLPFQFKRFQFPVKLCFAISINKSQGQTIKTVGVDLRHDCFSHGQVYVAFSRVSSPENLFVLQPTCKTKNIVYKQVLC
ncbi:unnamed protein product [Bemisia tabaci]|uniref:ATP-dependent DNA helicase n=1 Tax=Bemisia tabaci TaxID=7038 RepID=A0A9P0AIU9_BEMTA|nr:unnamed protein product [Bemisia tabaci]